MIYSCRIIVPLKIFSKIVIRISVETAYKRRSELISEKTSLSSHQVIPGNYCKVIDEFSVEWYKRTDQFNISTTPKIHIILSHLCDYFDKTQLSLAKTSDEVIENCHQYMHKRMMKGYWVKNISSPNHGLKLFNCIRHMNSYSLLIKNNVK